MKAIIKHKRMEEIVIAIRSHSTLKEAASSLNCGVRTLQRYMNDPEFTEVFFEFARQSRLAAVVTCAAVQQQEMLTLASHLESPSDPVSLKASTEILKMHDSMIAEAQYSEQIRLLKDVLLRKEPEEEA